MKRWISLAIIVAIVACFCCRSFVNQEVTDALKQYDEKIFIMKNSVTVNQETLSKGQRVRVKFIAERGFIKARGYRADLDPLVAKQVLLLMIFKEDFPKKKLSADYFFEKLRDIAVPLDDKK